MYSSTTFSLISLLLFLFLRLGTACVDPAIGSTVDQDCQEITCNPPPAANDDGITVLGTTSGPKKRDVWDPIDRNNTTWPREGYSYQVSPYYKPAAVLRECSGSIVTSFDTIHANLEGRGQTWVSQRNYSEACCTNSTPIRLISGGGAVSTILQADIPFPGGILHIVDKLLTVPTKLSTTLRGVAPAAFNKLINGFRAYDNVPSSTFFIPSDAALAKSCSYTLAPGQARSLINAQLVKGFVAYSPALVDGAFFKSGNGEDITITVKADGTKYANNIKIVQQDIIVENGVVHIIDGLFSSPSTSCAGPPVSKTITVISTIYLQSTVYQPGSTVYQSGPTITQGTNCLPAPTMTVYPGSCTPSTTTVFLGQGTCPAPTTFTSTLTPTACTSQGPGASCTTSVISTTTVSPTACVLQFPGSSCTPVTTRITVPPTGCLSSGSNVPPTSGCLPNTTSITTTILGGPTGCPTLTACLSGTACPSPTACPIPSTQTTTTTSITTTTSTVPGQLGANITISIPGPTIYTTITSSICLSVNQPPPGIKSEDCDEFGVPYGPGNPHTRPFISALWQGLGGSVGTSTTAVPITPTGKPTISTSAQPAYGGSSGGGYGYTTSRW